MRRFRHFAFVSIVFVCLLALSAGLSSQTIPLTVDATGTQQKLIARERSDSGYGWKTNALLPQVDSWRARTQWTDCESHWFEICGCGKNDSVGARHAGCVHVSPGFPQASKASTPTSTSLSRKATRPRTS